MRTSENGASNRSNLDEDQSLLGDQTGVDLNAATITEVRVLDENGDVVAVDSNDDIAACVDVLGIEVADVDTELTLQLGLLTDGLNDTEIEALNEAIDTGEISQDELVNLANLRENGDLTADEFGSALLSSDVAQAIDDLLTSLL